MPGKTIDQKDISERLHEAIDGLRKDATRVEIWATALASFSQPVPDYRPNPKYELGRPVRSDPLNDEKRSESKAGNPPDKA